MEDFTIKNFMVYYSDLLRTLEHMHIIAIENLAPICKGCLKQDNCWTNTMQFKDLCLYENRCFNYLPKEK